jgi:hypothetical protein
VFTTAFSIIGYMRAIPSLGGLIELLRATLKDMVAFVLVLLSVMMSFAWAFYILDLKNPKLLYGYDIYEGDAERISFLDILQRVLLMSFGDFEFGGDFEKTPRIVFNICIFLITLVMMNLLIAIVSDTYT